MLEKPGISSVMCPGRVYNKSHVQPFSKTVFVFSFFLFSFKENKLHGVAARKLAAAIQAHKEKPSRDFI